MDLLTVNDQPGRLPPSYYAAVSGPPPTFPALAGEISCDVCVVGGGFTGLSTALRLAERGYHVVLLEAHCVGFGASGRNGGQVGQGHRVDQDVLEKALGREDAHAAWRLAAEAVEEVCRLCALPEVDTLFHPGVIFANHRARDVAATHAYVEELRDEYGYGQIHALDQAEMRATINSPAYYGGMLDLGSGHINPLRLAHGLARLAGAAGARIFERSRVSALHKGAPVRVVTEVGSVRADYVVLGCNGYLGDLNRRVADRVMPINNYIIATEPLTPDQQEQVIKNNYAVADSKFVINYFRFSEDNRLLFGGGESYSYRFPSDIGEKVRRPMVKIFPQLRDARIDYAWGGVLGITINRTPHFERIAGNIMSMSGYSGHGVALAVFAGRLAAEAIAGQAERFDLMAKMAPPPFFGGPALRMPLLTLAMLWFSLRDRL
ncbi:MAG: FAD-binding oxidoreductase [Rhodobacteraceae bacterium]|nr:FAD-binding oxidoreductase [Paracoccaceae bacterium]